MRRAKPGIGGLLEVRQRICLDGSSTCDEDGIRGSRREDWHRAVFRLNWWQDQDWGTVPDWFAAVGTTGALLISAQVLRGEVANRRRAEANQFSIVARWMEADLPEEPHEPGEGSPPYIGFTGRNSGSKPILTAHVDLLLRDGSVRGVAAFGNVSTEVLAPGEDVDWGNYFPFDPEVGELFLSFIDGNGRSWRRSLTTYDYVSDRRWRRLTRASKHQALIYKYSS